MIRNLSLNFLSVNARIHWRGILCSQIWWIWWISVWFLWFVCLCVCFLWLFPVTTGGFGSHETSLTPPLSRVPVQSQELRSMVCRSVKCFVTFLVILSMFYHFGRFRTFLEVEVWFLWLNSISFHLKIFLKINVSNLPGTFPLVYYW